MQKKPSIRKPIEKSSMKKLQGTVIFGFEKCPKGTIPIRRTTKEELIQEKQLLSSSIFVKDISGVHVCWVFELKFKFPWFISTNYLIFLMLKSIKLCSLPRWLFLQNLVHIMESKEALAFITQELLRVKCPFLMSGFKMDP